MFQRTLIIACILLGCYLYVLPRWADWNQNSRLDLVRALSERGDVVIDAYAENTGDYALYKGHKYSDKAPGPAFLAFPVALAARPLLDHPFVQQRLEQVARGGSFGATMNPEGSGLAQDKMRAFVLLVLLTVVTVALPTVFGALALGGMLRHLGVSEALATVLVLAYGVATPLATYAGNFYSHALVASLLVGAWALITRPYAAARAVAIGMLLGWAAISEYPSVLPGAAIGIAALWLWRRPAAFGWMMLGALPPLLLLAMYDLAAFGTPLPVGYSHSALWQDKHQTGFISITYPHAAGLWGLTFGAFRGLFVRAPWLLLAVPGYVLWWQRRQFRAFWWVSLIGAGSTLLFYASSVMWWGGFAAGPRYIVAALPFLALAVAPAAVLLWRHAWGRWALVALVLVSAGLTWAEATAGQSFPPDSIANPWIDHTFMAWREGDIARNVGTALGLRGGLSLLPLLGWVALALVALRLAARPPAQQPVEAVEGATIAPFQH